MQKSLKYVPTGIASNRIKFSSEKGSVEFSFLGDEQTVSLEVYEALLSESSEFKFCIENRVIVAGNVPDSVVNATQEQQPKSITDSTEELSAAPKTVKK